MTRIGRASPTGFASAPGVLGDLAITVEHAGSTAVPGLCAKPVIELDVVVGALGRLNEALDRLATLGYGSGGRGGVVASVAGLAAARRRARSDIITCTSSSLVAGCTASALAF